MQSPVIHPAALNAASRIAAVIGAPVRTDFAPYAAVYDTQHAVAYLVSARRGIERVFVGEQSREIDAYTHSNRDVQRAGLMSSLASWSVE